MKITIYTSINSGGYDVQVWCTPEARKPFIINANRFSTREAGHKWATEYLDNDSLYKNVPRIHER